MSTEIITFPSASGERLSARLELPAGGPPVATALFAHCFTCTKNIKAAVNISRALAAERIAVLRFDFTGLGESEGDFADTNFSSNVADVIAAGRFLESEMEGPSILVGHSLGGAAVLHAAQALDSVKAVATIGAPADPAHVVKHMHESLEEIEERGEAEVLLAGRPFRIKRQFLDDLNEVRMEETVRGLDRALLLFHSPVDTTVDVDNASRLYAMAKHPKSFISLDTADHLVSDEEDSRYIGAVLAAWARKYVDLDDEPAEDGTHAGQRVVSETGPHGYRTEIVARGHRLVADEPKGLGGEDTGPTPYDLLLASLGACTGITLRMYADRKGWSLDRIGVSLDHQKVHPTDCEDCEDDDVRLDQVERSIELQGDLSPEQRERLMEIADRCPVHRTLEVGMRINTSAPPGER
jgi:uncharacterized OsmC-like protein/pimeloyl-ACP methyl ester carboxylesterase